MKKVILLLCLICLVGCNEKKQKIPQTISDDKQNTIEKENTSNIVEEKNNDTINNETNDNEVDNNIHEKSNNTNINSINNNSNSTATINNNENSNINNNSNTNNNNNDNNNNNGSNDNVTNIEKNDNKIEKEKIITIEASKKFYCISNDYILDGDICKKEATISSLQKYVCGENETLNGYNCTYNVKIPLTNEAQSACVRNGLSNQGSCHSTGCSLVGGTYSSSDDKNGSYYWCYKYETRTKAASISYYCPDGYTYNEQKCIKTFTINANYDLYCPDDYTFTGKDCVKVVSSD